MQKKTNWATVWAAMCFVAILVLGSAVMMTMPAEQDAPEAVNYSLVSEMINAAIPDGLTADDVADLIKTDGEGVYKVSDSKANQLRSFVENKDKDFVEMFAEHVDVDEDYLLIKVIDRKDTEVTAATENDKDDENYDVAVFYKIKYKDVDEDDYDYAYILVETQYDEGDLDEDEVVITEVSRDFEF